MTATLVQLEAIELLVPLPRPLEMGALRTTERGYVVVRAVDDDGHVGTAYALSRNAPVAATIRRLIAPRWVGQPLDSHADVYAATVRGNVFLGTNGIFWRALSLADCALFDLLAKRAGQPLHAYLGGAHRIVPTTLAGVYPTAQETEASLTELMQRLSERRPAGIKITSSSDYARDTRRLEIARRAIPDGPPFINDLYGMAGSADALIPTARRWADFGMMWVEDPFTFDDYDNLARLADALDYPVGVGDEQSGYLHLRRLIEQGRVRVLRLDVTTCGGVRAFLDLAAMAAERGVPVSSHVYHFIHAQLACVAPNHRWVEYMLPESGAESIHLLLENDLEWRDGGLVPTRTPGVGYRWDDDALRRYRIEER